MSAPFAFVQAWPTTIHGMSAGLPSFDEAAATVAEFARGLVSAQRKTERVDLSHASGRVLAGAVIADQDQPPFARSTRDGFACRAAEASAHMDLTVAGMTHAGEAPAPPLPESSAWEIMTGAVVPAGADAVVMLEHVERDHGRIRLLPKRTIRAGDNIVAQGAQARRGAVVLSAGVMMGPAQVAVAAACGYAALEVFARPRVAILTTGDELVAIEAEPGPGQIRNSNAPMLAALVSAAGGEAWVLPMARDTAEALDAVLQEIVEAQSDMLIISGGVSAGKFDLVEPALARIGARFHFTGVRIQPGKPLVFGEVKLRKRMLPFFGLPGNPISSAATFLLFGAPVLAALAGTSEPGPRFVMAQLKKATDRNAKPGLTRFLPAWCEFNPRDGGVPQVATVPWHGSGDLPAFGRSNCFAVVPEEVSSVEAGTMVRILIF
jgi:molybdopterin molybdotransferase